ncbi:hypothetical protein Dimus_015419 [Dionaea muscipula]
MAIAGKWRTILVLIVLIYLGLAEGEAKQSTVAARKDDPEQQPTPKAWPPQFHSILVMNYTGKLQLIDLWYDWPNGRNFNIIRSQLGDHLLYDLEWNNGTTFYYTLAGDGVVGGVESCRSIQMEVGILRPNWLDGAEYLGQRSVGGFQCNVWQKADFILYYEDVATRRPVHWRFYTGREAHVMTFEVGAVLEDSKWQAPHYCFGSMKDGDAIHSLSSQLDPSMIPLNFGMRGLAAF